MYASGEIPMVGDIVQRGDEGEVAEITPNVPSGEETATVKWTTPYKKANGINTPLAPSSVPTRLLRLVRRKA